jgi:uncharacterized protein
VNVVSLIVYPIKSLRGVVLARSPLDRRGLRWDRRWMIVDEHGVFLSQRSRPLMALLDQELDGDLLRVHAPSMRPLEHPIADRGDRRRVTIWGDRVSAEDAGDDAARWFTEALGSPARLVFMPETARRRVKSPEAMPGDLAPFSDACPVLVASEASLADLNARLARPIEMIRFRPNVVIDGCEPFAEDDFPSLDMKGVRLRRIKRCGRCLVTTIDPATGLSGTEPLRTLAEYRKFGRNACFGSYYAPEALGDIAVGDRVRA